MVCAQGFPTSGSAATAGRGAARIEVDVRMMRGEEIRARTGDSVLPPEAVGLFALPQALLSPAGPDQVTAAVVGPPGGVEFEGPARAILAQLSAGGLGGELADRIREHMRRAELEAGDLWDFDVAIAYLGLQSQAWRPAVQSESAPYCLVAAGRVSVGGLNGAIANAPFRRGVDVSSDGMPGPECRPLTDYAAGGGAFLRQAIREMAGVLGAWIANYTLQQR